MAGVQGPRHGLLPSAFARDRAGFARRHHGRLCRELAGCREVFRRRLRSLHRPSTPASYTSSLDPHDEFDRALVRRRTSADEDRAECFRREARPEADVRCAHPRCRRLARLALHRIRTASARRREKRSGRRIRGLYHPISQAISAASFQQSRALTTRRAAIIQRLPAFCASLKKSVDGGSTSKPEVPMFRARFWKLQSPFCRNSFGLGIAIAKRINEAGLASVRSCRFTTKGYDANPHWFAPHPVRD